MPSIEEEMRGQMGHWETHTPGLRKQFDYMLEKKFGTSPRVVEALLKVGRIQREAFPEGGESFLLDIIHHNDREGLSDSMIRLNFFPADRKLIITISIIGSVKKDLYSTPVFCVQQIFQGDVDDKKFLINSEKRNLLLDAEKGELYS
jgi:hypothetical protein